MAYIKIAQAGLNEWGGTHGGQAGNQLRTAGNLDGELNVHEWYNKPWTYCIRPKDSVKAAIMAKTAYECVKNKKVGYDQSERQTLYWQMKANNWDASKVGYCETDCSSLWAVCANAAGIPIDPVCWTGILADLAKNSGEFEILTDAKYLTGTKYLKKGDALLKPNAHVVICIDETVEEPIYDGDDKFETPYITTGKVWLRKGPGMNYDTIVAIPKDSTVLACHKENDWVHIMYGSYVGYSYINYLKELEQEYSPVDKYTTGDVNIRKDAGTGYPVVGVIAKGTLIRCSGKTKKVGTRDWYEVSYNGSTGYVSGLYLKDAPTKITFKTTGKVNMRTGPSTDYHIITSIDAGVKVVSDGTYQVAQGYRWYKCTYSDNSGYISAKYLTEV